MTKKLVQVTALISSLLFLSSKIDNKPFCPFMHSIFGLFLLNKKVPMHRIKDYSLVQLTTCTVTLDNHS